MPSGSPNATYGMIKPGHVSNRPSARSMLNMGVTSEIAGNMAISSAIPISTCLPGKASLATAYAAMDASRTAMMVAISPIPIELSSGLMNWELCRMPL